MPMWGEGGEREREALSTYTHGKGTAKVIENDKGTRVASVIHGCERESSRRRELGESGSMMSLLLVVRKKKSVCAG